MINSNTGRSSGNPVFDGWYADPEMHIFEGSYYIYPTTSLPFDQQTFFEVWSSKDMLQWRNEGHILNLADIPWSGNRAAWAPSVCYRNSLYYFYFSAGDGNGIGVATSTSPTGPFTDALGRPLVKEWPHGAQPIDAHIFINDDERAFLYFGGHGHAVVVELNDDMVSLRGAFYKVTPESYVEGPFLLKRNGIYYFFWSEGNWSDSSYAVAYAMSTSPFGPFVRHATILQSRQGIGKGPGHNSVINLLGTDEWYIVYHRRPVAEDSPHHRVVCIDRLYFDENGHVEPVEMTLTGVEARPLRLPPGT